MFYRVYPNIPKLYGLVFWAIALHVSVLEQKFSSKTDTCNYMAQKIHGWIDYDPISFLNVSIHAIEHTEVNNFFFKSLYFRARVLKIDKGVNLFRKITGS